MTREINARARFHKRFRAPEPEPQEPPPVIDEARQARDTASREEAQAVITESRIRSGRD